MKLAEYIQEIISKTNSISEERKSKIEPLLSYLIQKRNSNEAIHLNFVCTHNSRRSQFAQIWAQTAAAYYGFECSTYSSGVCFAV